MCNTFNLSTMQKLFYFEPGWQFAYKKLEMRRQDFLMVYLSEAQVLYKYHMTNNVASILFTSDF